MAEFFKTSTIWVVDFLYDDRARRWFKACGPDTDMRALMASLLETRYGRRALLVDVRPANYEEETQYLRGEEPKNRFCPTNR